MPKSSLSPFFYPTDEGYVKADPSGDSVISYDTGMVCHELFDEYNATVNTISGRTAAVTPPTPGAVEVTLSWGEGRSVIT